MNQIQPETSGEDDFVTVDPSVTFQQLAPNHLQLTRWIGSSVAGSTVLVWVIGLAGYAAIANSLGSTFWVVVLVSLLVAMMLFWATWIYPKLAYQHAAWRLGPSGLEIRRGVWWRHHIVIAVSRIQHSDIEQGPLQRNQGIATLVVHTAGTRNASVQLEGLAIETAQQLRDTMISGRQPAKLSGGSVIDA